MPRSVPEWIGKSDDSRPTKAVRLRIWDRHGGICHICSLPIQVGEEWHADHILALIEGGENREMNLAPAHARCNTTKAAGETSRKSASNRKKSKHIGIAKTTKPIQSRGFARSPKSAKREKHSATQLPIPPRKALYERG